MRGERRRMEDFQLVLAMPVPAAPSPPVAPPSTCASSSLVPTGLAMGYLMTVQGAGEREEAFDRCTFRACRSPRSDEGHGSRQSGGRCSISWALHAVIDSVVCCLALRHSGVVPETLPAHGAARSRRAAPPHAGRPGLRSGSGRAGLHICSASAGRGAAAGRRGLFGTGTFLGGLAGFACCACRAGRSACVHARRGCEQVRGGHGAPVVVGLHPTCAIAFAPVMRRALPRHVEAPERRT